VESGAGAKLDQDTGKENLGRAFANVEQTVAIARRFSSIPPITAVSILVFTETGKQSGLFLMKNPHCILPAMSTNELKAL
jgi:hypothetical protein